jgi:hypothetical protein
MAYTLKEDYTEQYTDGSGRYKTVFRAGQSISWETAYAVGLVTTKHEPKEEAKPVKAQKEETQRG